MANEATQDTCSISHKKSLISLLLLMAVVAVGIAIWLSQRPGKPEEAYRIGAVLPLSGSLGYVGKMEGDGMRLAVEDINANGGINGLPIELKFDDSQGKPDVAVTATQKMMTVDGIKVIMAPLSSVVLGIKPVVERNKGVLIGCCMHPDFFKDSPNVFRFYEGVEDEAKGLVDYFGSLSAGETRPRIGILYAEVPNVRSQIEEYIRPGIKQKGLDFVVMEPYRLSDKEFRSKVLKIRSANLTHLMVIGYGFLYPNIFRELKEQKVIPGVQIVGGWGFLYPKLGNSDLEGVVVVGPEYVFKGGEKVDAFYERFKTRFGYEANFDAAMTYAAVQVLAKGLEEGATSDSSVLAECLHNATRHTIVGKVVVGQNGEISFPIGVGEFVGGKLIDAGVH